MGLFLEFLFLIFCLVRVSVSSVAQSCLTLSSPMDYSTPGFHSSPTLGACSNSCPLSQWCYPTISSSIVLFFSCLQSFPASGFFPKGQFFTSGDQSIGASASVPPMNIEDWFPLRLTGLISKGLSRVFSNTTAQKHQFFGVQSSLNIRVGGQNSISDRYWPSKFGYSVEVISGKTVH